MPKRGLGRCKWGIMPQKSTIHTKDCQNKAN